MNVRTVAERFILYYILCLFTIYDYNLVKSM